MMGTLPLAPRVVLLFRPCLGFFYCSEPRGDNEGICVLVATVLHHTHTPPLPSHLPICGGIILLVHGRSVGTGPFVHFTDRYVVGAKWKKELGLGKSGDGLDEQWPVLGPTPPLSDHGSAKRRVEVRDGG
jgi:hypothetical protein